MRTGRIVVVTGSAGGIGAAVARRFLDNGDRLIGIDRTDHPRELVASEAFTGATADVTDEAALAGVAAAVAAAHGGVDVLVHCAGWYPLCAFEDMTADAFRRVVDVNLTGAFLTVRAFWPLMRGRSWGRIVIVGSASVFEGVEDQIHYVSAKAGLFGLVRSLAPIVGRGGVTINVVTPGLTSTAPIRREMSADVIAEATARRALPREEQAEDLAGPILFLASPDAGFVSGQTLNVDGGSHKL